MGHLGEPPAYEHPISPRTSNRGAGHDARRQQFKSHPRRHDSRLVRRGRRGASTFQPVGEQSDVVNAGGPNFINDLDDIAVFRAAITLDKDGLIDAALDAIAHLRSHLIERGFLAADKDIAAAGNSDDDGVVFIGTLAISTDIPFCSMGVTTMKIINSTSMMSAIGIILGAAITGAAVALKCAMAYFFPLRRVMK
jgi:hypothetical protein